MSLSIAVAAPAAHAATAPSLSSLKSVDVMKYTKDVMTAQPSDAQILSVVQSIKSSGANAVAVSIPMDPTSDYPASSKPAPRTAEAFTQAWADAIHSAGMHIIWRGTFNGIEGLYGFPAMTGTSRVDPSVWTSKIHDYIVQHPSYFADGDVWAPLPERTQGIFSDSTSFLPAGTNGVQAEFAQFFDNVKSSSDSAFAQIGKNVTTGMTANNASEAMSGWLPKSISDSAGYVAVDYYGTTHTPQEMDHDLRAMAASAGKPVFLEEWGDYWNAGMDPTARAAYLASMYAEMQTLEKDGVLAGVNYWGGWDNNAEGVLSKSADGSSFSLNSRGDALKSFFSGNAALTAQPVTQVAAQAVASIDFANACAWQYPGKNAMAKQDISGNSYSWSCYGATMIAAPAPVQAASPAAKLGGIDLGSYCRSLGHSGAQVASGFWSCDGASIDMHAACAWQYPGQNAVDKQDDQSNPYSWGCYGFSASAPAPAPVTPVVTKLGGVDLGSYCASLNEGGAAVENGEWTCKT